jgi:serine/threonine protein kinase
MELCNGGSLYDCLQNYKKKYKKPFTEEIVQYLMKQILSGVKCLHDQKIIHRDLKLSNILIKYKTENDIKNLNILSGQVKIIDFNASTKPGIISAKTAIGTPPNMAPSVVNNFLGNRDNYDEKIDIWSLGTLCYEMLIGKELFEGTQIMQKIKNFNDLNIPQNISEIAKSFLLSMLQKESDKRLSVNDLLNHEFITKNSKNFNSINIQKNN